jgi:hypothetical protein
MQCSHRHFYIQMFQQPLSSCSDLRFERVPPEIVLGKTLLVLEVSLPAAHDLALDWQVLELFQGHLSGARGTGSFSLR